MSAYEIEVGKGLPTATLLLKTETGVEAVALADRLRGRKVVIFGLPGAYTSTCSTAHVPSFIRTAKKFAEKGVDEIICVSVNDPYVMQTWGAETGATEAGITMMADADSSFTKAIGLAYDAPAVGFFGRSKRYSLLAVDGVVTHYYPEIGRGCEVSAGEYLLAQI